MTRHSGHLLITHPSGHQEAVPIAGVDMRIGSAADNDIVLVDSTAAAHHTRIRCNEHGDLTIAAAGIEIELPRASASGVTVRIGGYVVKYAAGEITDHSSDYIMRQGSVPAQYARTDEAALLSALLAGDEWAAHEPRLFSSHEAVTIEMPALSAAAGKDT